MKNIIKKLSILFKFYRDDKVSIPKKLLPIITLLYIISPIDLVPEPIILFGIIDDIVLFLYTASKFSEYIRQYQNKKNNKNSKVVEFKKKDVVENVDYDIEDRD